jgi:AbrB family looped-hinge helix DNA binding protein
MTSVAISPKFQIVIPKEVRRLFSLVPSQRVDIRAEDGKIIVVPVQPMSAACGIFPGLDTDVSNDPEDI